MNEKIKNKIKEQLNWNKGWLKSYGKTDVDLPGDVRTNAHRLDASIKVLEWILNLDNEKDIS